jgi:hypothetical protein
VADLQIGRSAGLRDVVPLILRRKARSLHDRAPPLKLGFHQPGEVAPRDPTDFGG